MSFLLALSIMVSAFLDLGSLSSIKNWTPQKLGNVNGTSGINTSKPFVKPWEQSQKTISEIKATTISAEISIVNSRVNESANAGHLNSTLDVDMKMTNGTIQEAISNDTFGVRQYPPLSKCTCYFQDSCGCACNQPLTWEEFQILPQNFVSCPGFTLSLLGGRFHSFPSNYFYAVGDVQDFGFDVSRLELQYLLDPAGDDSPFHGVSFDTSAFIRVHQVSVTRGWNWGGFYDLTPTRPLAYCEVQVVESTVPILTSDFGSICQGAVIAVNVNSCGMMALENRVFAPFYKLNVVDLSDNRLRVMMRSYFSYPALELEVISFAYNDIRVLPNNMFSGMPSLGRVDLRGNPITVLEEATFRPIFRSVQIAGLETLPLACDCRARWLKEPAQLCGVNTYGLAAAVCHSPGQLEGYSFFNDTLAKDLNC